MSESVKAMIVMLAGRIAEKAPGSDLGHEELVVMMAQLDEIGARLAGVNPLDSGQRGTVQ